MTALLAVLIAFYYAHPAAAADKAPPAAFGETPAPSAQATPQPAPEPNAWSLHGPAQPENMPRWLDDVRAQRRALQESRRAQHQARRRAIDPVGTARQKAMEQEFYRRRQEMRDMIAQDRKLFMNSGPWQVPWPGAPGQKYQSPEASGTTTPGGTPPGAPPEWDNGWYFRGW